MPTRVDPRILRDPAVPTIFRKRGYFTSTDGAILPETVTGTDVLPATGTQTTETERFSIRNALVQNTLGRDATAVVAIRGLFSRYIYAGTTMQYYVLYAAWGVTSAAPPTAPTTWEEVTMAFHAAFNYATSGWYDNLPAGTSTCVTIPAGNWLWLRLRGTSWAETAVSTSVGFRAGKVVVEVYWV